MKAKQLIKVTSLCALAIGVTACGGGGGGGNGGGNANSGFPAGIYVNGSTGELYRSADMQGNGWSTIQPGGATTFTFDSQGRLYLAGGQGKIKMKADPNTPTTSFGAQGSGVGQFDGYVNDIEVDAQDKIYVLDSGNKRVVRMDDFTGKDWVSLDLSSSCPGNAYPSRMAVSPTGAIYITISSLSHVVQFDSITDPTPVTFGSSGVGVNQFLLPQGICLDKQGRIYVTMCGGNGATKIIRFDDMTGQNWAAYGAYGSTQGQFNSPTDIFVDGANRIYVLDNANFRVVRINDMAGNGWIALGQNGSDPLEFEGTLSTLKVK